MTAVYVILGVGIFVLCIALAARGQTSGKVYLDPSRAYVPDPEEPVRDLSQSNTAGGYGRVVAPFEGHWVTQDASEMKEYCDTYADRAVERYEKAEKEKRRRAVVESNVQYYQQQQAYQEWLDNAGK